MEEEERERERERERAKRVRAKRGRRKKEERKDAAAVHMLPSRFIRRVSVSIFDKKITKLQFKYYFFSIFTYIQTYTQYSSASLPKVDYYKFLPPPPPTTHHHHLISFFVYSFYYLTTCSSLSFDILPLPFLFVKFFFSSPIH